MALAGATLEISFARFNKERALSYHFCRWEFTSMVKLQVVARENCVARKLWRRTQALMQIGGNFVITCLVQTVPPDQDNCTRGRGF